MPETLLEELDTSLPVVKLTFFGENSKTSLISDINKKFRIETTILFASVNELQDKILGILILQLKGDSEEIEKTENYIREKNVKIERVVLAHG